MVSFCLARDFVMIAFKGRFDSTGMLDSSRRFDIPGRLDSPGRFDSLRMFDGSGMFDSTSMFASSYERLDSRACRLQPPSRASSSPRQSYTRLREREKNLLSSKVRLQYKQESVTIISDAAAGFITPENLVRKPLLQRSHLLHIQTSIPDDQIMPGGTEILFRVGGRERESLYMQMEFPRFVLL